MVDSVNNTAFVPSAVADTGSLVAQLEGMQVQLADQVGDSVISWAKTLRDRAVALLAQQALLKALTARQNGTDPKAPASLGRNLAESDQMLADLNANGVPVSAGSSYLTVTKTVTTDSKGQQTVSWNAAWSQQTLSDRVADGDITLPKGQSVNPDGSFSAADWASVSQDPDAALLMADAGQVSDCSVAVTQDTSTTQVTTYCFEANPNIVVTNADITQWMGKVDTSATQAAASLDLLNAQARAAFAAYEQVLGDGRGTRSNEQRRTEDRASVDAQTVREQQRQRDILLADALRSHPAPTEAGSTAHGLPPTASA
jgi:hypothetical protein